MAAAVRAGLGGLASILTLERLRPLGWRGVLALSCLTLGSGSAAAQVTSAVNSPAAAFRELRAIDDRLKGPEDPRKLDSVETRAAEIGREARDDLGRMQADLRRVDDQTAQLGAAPKGLVEASDIRARRAELTVRHAAVDSAMKRVRLLSAEASHIVAEVQRRRAQAFRTRLSARSVSPFLPAFWRSAFAALPAGLARLEDFMGVQGEATRRGIEAGHGWLALLGLIAAAILVFPARSALRRGGQRVMIDHAPGSRLRRSGLALWLTAINTLVPLVGGVVLVRAFAGAAMLAPSWASMATSFELALAMAALIDALGGALLQRNQPSWRLTPVGDATAARLRPWTRIAAVVACMSILFTGLGEAAALSTAVRDGGDLFVTVAHLALMLGILMIIGRIRILAAAETVDDTRDDRSLAGVALVLLAAWAGVGAAGIALACGYVQFALMLSRLLLWLPTVAAGLYLLLLAVDDLCTELIAGRSSVGRTMHDAFGLRHSTVDQFGVALSATLRVLLILAAVGIAFAPFGANFARLVATVGDISHGVTLGEVTIAPLEILRAFAVLGVGLGILRVVGGWLTERYLPTTELDPAARHSISTIATYFGIIVVVLWSLTALGIGFQRIALILSALSVGIGFGLQAITQNFVSGLILLIERPVKIGDLVRVGDQEGDVRRIRVRATEIVAGDRSTLIVPNSELITKTVRNMTLADPIGRLQIRFAVALGPRIAAVRAIMMDLFADAPAVLDDPEPKVSLESLDDGAAHFSCVAFVSSPRQVAGVRSELLFALVEALESAGIVLGGPAPPVAAVPTASADDA